MKNYRALMFALLSVPLASYVACNSGGGGGGSGGSGAGGSASGGDTGTGGSTAEGGSASGGSSPNGGSGNGGSGGASGGAGGASGGAGGASGGAGGTAGGGAGGAATGVEYFVYVSGPADHDVEGWKFNIETGAMTRVGAVNAGVAPTYLSGHGLGKAVYATNEQGAGKVYSLKITPGTGALTGSKNVPTGGNNAVHVWTHPSNNFLLVSNYAGNISTFPLDAMGAVGTVIDTKPTGNTSHQVMTDPAGKFVFAPCKDANIIAGFSMATDGKLTALVPASVALNKPRHMSFHPSAKYAYVVTEETGDVVSYNYNATTGALTDPQTVDLAASENWGAHIKVTPDGKWVFASGRRQKSLYGYAVNATTGRLTANGVEAAATLGEVRDFDIDPTGKYLLAARQDASTVSVYKIGTDGKLTAAAGSPVTTTPTPQGIVVVAVPKP